MSQNRTTVLWEVNGSINILAVSGFKIMSDSFIAFQPAIEEPSMSVKKFINANSKDEIIFTKNATEAINLVASKRLLMLTGYAGIGYNS